MALTPQLWSLNGLAVELKIYRVKLAEALATLEPDSVDPKAGKRWLMHRVVSHLREKDAGVTKLDRTQEDARLKSLQADRLEMDLELRRGETVRTEDVGEVLDAIVTAFRSRVLALPKRLAPVVIGMKKAGEAQAKIEKDVHHALKELAGLDPDQLIKQVRRKYKKAPDDGEAE